MKNTFSWSGGLAGLLVFSSISFSSLSYARYSHEEVVNEFLSISRGDHRPSVDPNFKNPYSIPTLDEVVPPYMQLRLRNRQTQGEPSFESYATSRDFRHRDTPIMSQIGSRCSAYGLVASIENLLGAPRVAKLSESHLWSQYRRYSSVRAVEAAKRMAIAEYSVWPHNRDSGLPGWEEKTHTKLNYITFIEDDLTRAVETLEAGRPVYIGMSVTRAMKNCDAVLDPDSQNTGGGHAVSISGYGIDKRIPGGGYFIIKNSWSKKCGDEGYQYMPFSYCSRGGSSYCIMWDVQGVTTGFAGVPSVEPDLPEFDITRMDVRISSHRDWWRRRRTVMIDIEGDSLHARQIKEVSYALDGGSFSKPKKNDLDAVTLSFTTSKTMHNIALKYKLRDGSEVESQHRWRLKNINR